jgi:glucosamine--fructose-6-phosphate aminotransferase (isomerizing)
MCGIIAIVRRPSGRAAPPSAPTLEALDYVAGRLGQAAEHPDASIGETLAESAATLNAVNRSLTGTAGVACLLSDGLRVAEAVADRSAVLSGQVERIERRLDAGEVVLLPSELEVVNAGLIAAKDAVWAIKSDRVRSARAVADLAWVTGNGGHPQLAQPLLDGLWAIQAALSAIDRLEVRGRDSAGLHLLIDHHGLTSPLPTSRPCWRSGQPTLCLRPWRYGRLGAS